MSEQKEMRKVEITWDDSIHRNGGWEQREEVKSMPPSICHSVGYVFIENEQWITIIQSHNLNEIMFRLTIPRKNILEEKELT